MKRFLLATGLMLFWLYLGAGLGFLVWACYTLWVSPELLTIEAMGRMVASGAALGLIGGFVASCCRRLVRRGPNGGVA